MWAVMSLDVILVELDVEWQMRAERGGGSEIDAHSPRVIEVNLMINFILKFCKSRGREVTKRLKRKVFI